MNTTQAPLKSHRQPHPALYTLMLASSVVAACSTMAGQHDTIQAIPTVIATTVRPTTTTAPPTTNTPVLAAFPGTLLSYAIPIGNTHPTEITLGPDGNVWFTEESDTQIGRVTPQGKITEFPLADAQELTEGIVTGADGNLWFTESGVNKLGRMTPQGALMEFQIASPTGTPFDAVNDITLGPDGSLWFTQSRVAMVGRSTPVGNITLFPLPDHGGMGDLPGGIAAGPDGALWFVEEGADRIGRITQHGDITEFRLPHGTAPHSILTGSDGNLWFSELGTQHLGRMTPHGALTEFPLHCTAYDLAYDGMRQRIWFTETFGTCAFGMVASDGTIHEYALPLGSPPPYDLALGGDGALWYTAYHDNEIARLTINK